MANRWVVAVACCCLNILILGTGRLSPVIFVASLERYKADRGKTSFPFILCYLLRTISGPLIGYLGAKFGSKNVTILGCFMAACGVGACFFAEDILAITLLFGVLYGLGFGFGASLVPAILCLHFKDNLTVASGLSYVGSSIGGAILPPIGDVIMRHYGVSGMFLVLGAIILNSVPCAMLLGDPAPTTKTISTNDEASKTNEIVKHEQDSQNKNSLQSKASLKGVLSYNNPTSNIEGYTNKGYNNEDAFSANNFGKLRVKRRMSSVLEVTPETPVLMSYTSDGNTTKSVKSDTRARRRPSSMFEITMATPVFMQYDSKRKSSVLYTGNSILNTKQSESSESAEESGLGSFKIFCDPVFVVICFIQSAYTFHITVVWTVLLDYVRDKGIEQNKEMFFLIGPPASDMFGRLLMGFVVDAGIMSETTFVSACFVLLSLTCCMMAWFSSFGLMLFATLTNAFVSGATIITFPGMIVNFMEQKDRTMAMASRLVLYAPMGMAVSPSIDYFRDTLGSYNGFFYVLGLVSGLCCVLTYFIPHLSRKRQRKLEENDLKQSSNM